MDSQLPLRILEAVGLLHRLGYLGLRILPGINASGTAWRMIIHNVTEWDPEAKYGGPYNAKESCVYSTAGANVFNNDVHFPEDVSHVSLAEAILEAMPSLQRSTPEETGNLDYVRWYAQLLSQVTRLDELPVAYADYFDDSEGWELGWGSDRRFPAPPRYLPEPDAPLVPAKAGHRDEHYVLDLCAEVLGMSCAGQQTFDWLRGEPSLKSGKRKALPVDGYFEELGLVVEYHERQHSEPVPFFDNKVTSTGMLRGSQRKLYDARKAALIPQHGLTLLVIDYRDFFHKKGKIVRDPARDREIVAALLARSAECTDPGVVTNFPVPLAETLAER
ncbi:MULTISPECIES: hypothetical protein [Glutamicibacter]|uniref:hypothetical protein n=1 Tax=Glutamicibacter TaxID=1742989 RepID=UPI00257CBDCB|nr:hypothetical protein [Glutamicibacter sp.]